MPGATDSSRETFWRKTVARQRASGLAVKRFCQREGLAVATFYLWKRRIVGQGSGPQQEVHFAPVQVVSQQPESGSGGVIEIQLGRERCIRLHGPVDGPQLALVVAVLEASGRARAC